MTSDLNDLLGSGGAPAFKFQTIGDTIRGTIVSTETRQQRDYATGDLKFWDDGKPMMEAVITLQTDLRDPTIQDDDGQRRIFVRGRLLGALRDARTAAKVDRIDVGGTLAVRYTGDGEPPKPGFRPPKLFTAEYRPPAEQVNDLLGDTPTPQGGQGPVQATGSLLG